ncbi:uncharacterized protein LOC119173582 isoform X1 [Rhipicephalus microplus]|uniref:uncharacterized protein LOC119173582 isoform X1 n=1 Tax=Rhipicephalus microplus TaxID=6941 RepID=UPI003F6CB1F0
MLFRDCSGSRSCLMLFDLQRSRAAVAAVPSSSRPSRSASDVSLSRLVPPPLPCGLTGDHLPVMHFFTRAGFATLLWNTRLWNTRLWNTRSGCLTRHSRFTGLPTPEPPVMASL